MTNICKIRKCTRTKGVFFRKEYKKYICQKHYQQLYHHGCVDNPKIKKFREKKKSIIISMMIDGDGHREIADIFNVSRQSILGFIKRNFTEEELIMIKPRYSKNGDNFCRHSELVGALQDLFCYISILDQ